MNYHAHIPAGMAFAATACLVSGMPLDIPMILAGGIGGALPDIDHPSGNSAITNIGSKAAKTIPGPLSRLAEVIGKIFDLIVMKPLTMIWLACSKNILSPLYFSLRNAFGARIGWDDEDPAAHRGGFTHSLFFVILTSLIMIAFTFIGNSIALILVGETPFSNPIGSNIWIGLELGIISHLFADSLCKSGVKWFWPWKPAIGFSDGTHKRGDGIRLLPVDRCVSTGLCPTKEDYMAYGRGTEKYRTMRAAYRREKMWQWIFKGMLLAVCTAIILGIGPGSGKVAWGESVVQVSESETDGDAKRSDTGGLFGLVSRLFGNDSNNGTGASIETDRKQGSAVDNEQAITASTRMVDENGYDTVQERKGPTSFTYGDLDFADLPRGIAKMPDESLYVIGVGAVNAETLESPTLQLTQEEKDVLLRAATAQRVSELPSDVRNLADEAQSIANQTAQGVSDTFNDAVNGITDIFNRTSPSGRTAEQDGEAGSASSDASDGTNNRSTYGGNSFTDWLGEIYSQDEEQSEGGFLGLTPFTKRR